ncbi:MAG: COG4223 family protein, partial [Pseudorhodoplanes sp.]
MATDDNAADAGNPRPRAAPTIDLKATELSSAPLQGESGKAEAPPAVESRADDPPAGPQEAPPPRKNGMSLRAAGLLGALSALAFFALGTWLGAVYRTELPVAPLPTAHPVPAPQPDPAPARESAAELVKPLEQGIAGLHKRLDELAAVTQSARERAEQAAATAQSARRSEDGIGRQDVDALLGRLAALERAVTEKAAEPQPKASDNAAVERRIQAAIAAVELRGAVERGLPYANELAVAKRFAGDADALATLAPFAATGIPSNAALARELAALAPAILHADAPVPANAFERLQARVAKLVHIRPRGEVEGDEPPHVVARAEAKTARGDLAGAAAVIELLPASLRVPAQA